MPSMVSFLGYTVLYLSAVRPTPNLHANPTLWETTLRGSRRAIACIGAPGASRDLGGARYDLEKKVLLTINFSGQGPPDRLSDDARRQLVDEFDTSSFPRHPKLSTAMVTSLWLCLSKDTCPTRA